MRKLWVFLIIPLFIVFSPQRVFSVVVPINPANASQSVIRANRGNLTPDLNVWIDDLGSHENCPRDGIIDSNGLKSYGLFCFQLDTFNRYSKKYGLSGSIHDNDFQKQLVALMIQEPGGWRNWYTTVTTKIGMPPL